MHAWQRSECSTATANPFTARSAGPNSIAALLLTHGSFHTCVSCPSAHTRTRCHSEFRVCCSLARCPPPKNAAQRGATVHHHHQVQGSYHETQKRLTRASEPPTASGSRASSSASLHIWGEPLVPWEKRPPGSSTSTHQANCCLGVRPGGAGWGPGRKKPCSPYPTPLQQVSLTRAMWHRARSRRNLVWLDLLR